MGERGGVGRGGGVEIDLGGTRGPGRAPGARLFSIRRRESPTPSPSPPTATSAIRSPVLAAASRALALGTKGRGDARPRPRPRPLAAGLAPQGPGPLSRSQDCRGPLTRNPHTPSSLSCQQPPPLSPARNHPHTPLSRPHSSPAPPQNKEEGEEEKPSGPPPHTNARPAGPAAPQAEGPLRVGDGAGGAGRGQLGLQEPPRHLHGQARAHPSRWLPERALTDGLLSVH